MALARTEVSEKRSASIIRVTRIGELGTDSCHPDDGDVTRRNMEGFLHSPRSENLKSYTVIIANNNVHSSRHLSFEEYIKFVKISYTNERNIQHNLKPQRTYFRVEESRRERAYQCKSVRSP
jgi:hypothetical protein